MARKNTPMAGRLAWMAAGYALVLVTSFAFMAAIVQVGVYLTGE